MAVSLPILLDPLDVRELPRWLAEIQWFDLTEGPFDERLTELIKVLKTIPTEQLRQRVAAGSDGGALSVPKRADQAWLGDAA